MAKWTREQIIRNILRREAAGLPLTPARGKGVEPALYAAGARIFGSWPNAVRAAGIAPDKAREHERWLPSRILRLIRVLARRRRPLRPGETQQRFGSVVQAARRYFGSWTKAVVAAGVNPKKLKRVQPWTKERIIEAILTRVLNSQPVYSRPASPRNLADAAAKAFGSWGAALVAAGLDPNRYLCRRPIAGLNAESDQSIRPQALRQPSNEGTGHETRSAATAASPATPASEQLHRRGESWTNEAIRHSILSRLHEHQRLNGTAVYLEDRRLYRAAARRYGNWRKALLAAGLNPEEFRRYGGRRRHR